MTTLTPIDYDPFEQAPKLSRQLNGVTNLQEFRRQYPQGAGRRRQV
jgi:hypothetical protein